MFNDEYLGEDGLYYCKTCNEPTIQESKDMFERRLCACERKRKEEEDAADAALIAADERENLKLRIKWLKEQSLLGRRYENVTFKNTDTETSSESFLNAYGRLKTFCDKYDKALQKGWWIFIYGKPGVGKSHLTACMANELMNEHLCQVLFTNFSDILSALKSTYNTTGEKEKESDAEKRFTTIDFLIIDDFGTEAIMKNGNSDTWAQDKLYNIINKRYNNKLPTIFNSNLKPSELITEKGLLEKTVERIVALPNVIIEIKGENYRRKTNEKAEF
jgi:DNA replication protein DnaC